jgi:putative endonuclease
MQSKIYANRINKREKYFYVYILSNKVNTVLYIGITNNLIRRVYEHKHKFVEGFTKRYNVNKLVYYETYNDPYHAITREKQLKAGSRKKKEELINSTNPKWKDLYEDII